MQGDSLFAITILVGIATAIISAFTVFYRKKQYEVNAKQLNLNAYLEVFKLLNDESHRRARRTVYRHHRARLDGKDLDQEEVSEALAMVRSDFDMIGTFIRNHLLSKDVFLDGYWDTTILCWNALEENIREERQKRQNSHYMANFEYLAAQAQEYKEKYMPKESVHPY